MKRIASCLLGVAAFALLANSQTATDSNEGTRLIPLGSNSYQFTWWGKVANPYLVEYSDDLAHWTYIPNLFTGTGGIISPPVGFTGITGDRLFVRLQTDPFHTDTDGDGIPDGWEIQYGLNPRDHADAFAMAPGGVTYLQKYQLGLNPTVADTDGDGMSDGDEIRFGTDPLDPSAFALAVHSSLPEEDQYGHPPNEAVVLTLTLPLPASVTSVPANFVSYYNSNVTPPTWENVAGTVTILPGRRAVAFIPDENFHPRPANVGAHNYQIAFTEQTTGIPSLVPFNTNFSVLDAPDTVGPWIGRVQPGENYIEVAKDFIPIVQWSQALNPATVLAANVSLRADGDATDLPVTVTFDYATNRLSIAPSTPFLADTRYTIALGAGFQSLMGVPLLNPFVWSFRTRPDPIIPVAGGGPSVTAITPQPYGNNVQTNSSVTITFSEAMNASTLTPQNIHLRAYNGSGDIPADFIYTAASRQLTILHRNPLSWQTRHEVILDAENILSAASTPQSLQGQTSYVFTTAHIPVSGTTTVADGSNGGSGATGSNGTNDPEMPKPLKLHLRYGEIDDDGDSGGSVTVVATLGDGSSRTYPFRAVQGATDVDTAEIPAGSSIIITPSFVKGSDPDAEEEMGEVGVEVSAAVGSASSTNYVVLKGGASAAWDVLGALTSGPFTAQVVNEEKLQIAPVGFEPTNRGTLDQGFDPPMEDDKYRIGNFVWSETIRDTDPGNWVWWTSLGKGPGISINEQSPGFNVNTKVSALLHDAATAQLCEIVVVDHADIVSVDPAQPTQARQPLTIWCTGANEGDIVWATIEIRSRKDHTTLATLKVMLMPVPTQLIPVKLYAIPDSDHPEATAVQGLPSAPDVQKELNDRFYQACLQFEVQTVPNPNPIHWDVSEPTNKLNYYDDTETRIFAQDGRFNNHVPVIFVHEIGRADDLGFTLQADHRIYMDDSKLNGPAEGNHVDGSEWSRVRVIAHEVGHYFSISSRDADRNGLNGLIHGKYHDTGAFPKPPLTTTGLMRPGETGGPGRWIRHEDWDVMWISAQFQFPNCFP